MIDDESIGSIQSQQHGMRIIQGVCSGTGGLQITNPLSLWEKSRVSENSYPARLGWEKLKYHERNHWS